MASRNETLREEAARCLEAAKQSKDSNLRAELVRLAANFLELAGQRRIDFDALLADYNAQQMIPPQRPSSSSNSNGRFSSRTTTKRNRT
jgi:hypothetical protein